MVHLQRVRTSKETCACACMFMFIIYSFNSLIKEKENNSCRISLLALCQVFLCNFQSGLDCYHLNPAILTTNLFFVFLLIGVAKPTSALYTKEMRGYIILRGYYN